MTEGYAALLISIFRRVGPEEAFVILNRASEERKSKYKLTDADYEEIRSRRLVGETWREIRQNRQQYAEKLSQVRIKRGM